MKQFLLLICIGLAIPLWGQTKDSLPGVTAASPEIAPEFPGGAAEMRMFMAAHLKTPQIVRDSAYNGRCYIRFMVDTLGIIRDIKVLKGVPRCPDCDKEVIRVIKAMPHWKPGKQNGKAVKMYYTVPVSFHAR